MSLKVASMLDSKRMATRINNREPTTPKVALLVLETKSWIHLAAVFWALTLTVTAGALVRAMVLVAAAATMVLVAPPPVMVLVGLTMTTVLVSGSASAGGTTAETKWSMAE